jgi:crotonobetainyl-CoA:carnitine CoA-transferase CaiB-like acyl-CoA transferase
VLARLGAEVIKVERIGGEETRYHSPWVGKQSAYWVQYNSGKKSVSMDLRKEEGKAALRKLVKVSDVLVQNFRPGTIEEMGFGYDVLKALNPRIIMVNVSAYGQFGPYRDQIGYDPIGQTMSGVAMVTGEDGMPPIRARGAHHRSHHRVALGDRHAGGPSRAEYFGRGAEPRRVPGGLRLQHDRDSHHCVSRRRNRASARQVRCAA